MGAPVSATPASSTSGPTQPFSLALHVPLIQLLKGFPSIIFLHKLAKPHWACHSQGRALDRAGGEVSPSPFLTFPVHRQPKEQKACPL